MHNQPQQRRSMGCSIRSLLVLTSIAAVVFALAGAAVRSEQIGDESLDTQKFVNFCAMGVMPFLGGLLGSVRFGRVRYIVAGVFLGGLSGGLLALVMYFSGQAAALLGVVLAAASIGLLGLGIVMRGRKLDHDPESS